MGRAKFFIVCLFVCVLVGTAWLLEYLRGRRQRKGLLRVARELGLDYDPADIHRISTRLSCTDTFGKGSASEVSNVLDGTLRGQKVTAFDFKHTLTVRSPDPGETRMRQCFSACVHPTLYIFPRLAIDLKDLPNDLEEAFARDAEVTRTAKTLLGDPTPGICDYRYVNDFFRGKYVKSESEDFTRYVCDPDMIKWLRQNHGWEIHFDRGYIVVIDGRNWSVEDFRRALDFTLGFLEHLPEDAR